MTSCSSLRRNETETTGKPTPSQPRKRRRQTLCEPNTATSSETLAIYSGTRMPQLPRPLGMTSTRCALQIGLQRASCKTSLP